MLCDLQKIQNVIIFQCQSPFQAELFSKYNDILANATEGTFPSINIKYCDFHYEKEEEEEEEEEESLSYNNEYERKIEEVFNSNIPTIVILEVLNSNIPTIVILEKIKEHCLSVGEDHPSTVKKKRTRKFSTIIGPTAGDSINLCESIPTFVLLYSLYILIKYRSDYLNIPMLLRGEEGVKNKSWYSSIGQHHHLAKKAVLLLLLLLKKTKTFYLKGCGQLIECSAFFSHIDNNSYLVVVVSWFNSVGSMFNLNKYDSYLVVVVSWFNSVGSMFNLNKYDSYLVVVVSWFNVHS
ncbi:hypothetical protein H8356DRAFT_1343953 [Neocallimastix lanati (nom. inval.)]|nr:hypothetical protein H8356DRAFT_1343953 [Neocallimastix sp. JGI-2020a]